MHMIYTVNVFDICIFTADKQDGLGEDRDFLEFGKINHLEMTDTEAVRLIGMCIYSMYIV